MKRFPWKKAALCLFLAGTLCFPASALSLSKTCRPGESLRFSAGDFSGGEKDFKGIVVTSLPDSSLGSLRYNGRSLRIFDAIPTSRLADLVFAASDGCAGQTSFQFKGYGNGASTTSTVTIEVEPEPAPAPLANDVKVSALKGKTASGYLKGYSKGKTLAYSIVTQPKNGSVYLSGPNGQFRYTPSSEQAGTDSFTYRVTDSAGGQSEEATVTVSVEEASDFYYYADMEDHWAHTAALTLAQDNILTGESIGAQHFFNPDKILSRGDFLVLLMTTCGLDKNLPEAQNTGFADDQATPQYLKKYIAYAKDQGILMGQPGKGGTCFYFSAPITRAQAFRMIDLTLDLPDIRPRTLTFDDADAVPTWASQSIVNLESSGMIKGFNNNTIRPDESITRAQAAEILCKVKETKQEQETKTANTFLETVFSWFR